MIAGEEMIMVFVMSAVLAIMSVVTMNNMAHWQEMMRPLDVEGGTIAVLL